MFTIDNHITDIRIKEKNLIKAFFSMNNHQVATPEMMLEEARSYILFFRERDGKISAYIGLHLLTTDRKLYYVHSTNAFPEQDMNPVEEEALEFLEGLGALIDELDFTKMSTSDKNSWIDKQEMFSQKTVAEQTIVQQAAAPGTEAPSSANHVPTASAGSGAAAPEQPVIQPQQIFPSPPAQQTPPAYYAPQQPQQQTQPPAPAPQVSPAPYAQPAPFAPPSPQQQPVPAAPQQVPPSAYVPPKPPIAPQPPQQQSQEEVVSPEVVIQEEQAPTESERTNYQEQYPAAQKTSSHAAARQEGVRSAGRGAAEPAPVKKKQDIMEKAIQAGIVKPPKTPPKKETQAAAGVVSRDREALARLLASF